MNQAEFEQNVKIAMTVFLVFAAIVFSAALVYSFVTGNIFAEMVLLSAAALITAVVLYAHKRITR